MRFDRHTREREEGGGVEVVFRKAPSSGLLAMLLASGIPFPNSKQKANKPIRRKNDGETHQEGSA
jgi:hypothetical protein